MKRIFEDFLIYKSNNDGLANRSIKAYRDILKRYEDWLNDREPVDISNNELLFFTGPYLHKIGLKPVSRRPYIACIREFYTWLANIKGDIKENPAQEIRYPLTGRRLPVWLQLQNAEKLLWQPDLSSFTGIRDSAIFAILMGCGLRAAGIVALNESNLITQVIDKEPRLSLRILEKGDKERILPVPKEADLLLRIYLEHPEMQHIDRVLPNGDSVLLVSVGNRKCPQHEYIGENRRLSVRGIEKIILKHGLSAGIPRAQLHPHAMRHLYGTELAESDIRDTVRMQLMGHSDPRSTQIYTHLASRKLTNDVDRSNPLSKLRTPVSELISALKGGN